MRPVFDFLRCHWGLVANLVACCLCSIYCRLGMTRVITPDTVPGFSNRYRNSVKHALYYWWYAWVAMMFIYAALILVNANIGGWFADIGPKGTKALIVVTWFSFLLSDFASLTIIFSTIALLKGQSLDWEALRSKLWGWAIVVFALALILGYIEKSAIGDLGLPALSVWSASMSAAAAVCTGISVVLRYRHVLGVIAAILFLICQPIGYLVAFHFHDSSGFPGIRFDVPKQQVAVLKPDTDQPHVYRLEELGTFGSVETKPSTPPAPGIADFSVTIRTRSSAGEILTFNERERICSWCNSKATDRADCAWCLLFLGNVIFGLMAAIKLLLGTQFLIATHALPIHPYAILRSQNDPPLASDVADDKTPTHTEPTLGIDGNPEPPRFTLAWILIVAIVGLAIYDAFGTLAGIAAPLVLLTTKIPAVRNQVNPLALRLARQLFGDEPRNKA